MTNAEFRVLDADALDLPDASVDGVINRFGYILRGDPPPALAEIRRVLRPGGRLVFSVWAARERNSWMTVPVDVMVERGHLEPRSEAEMRLSARRNPESIRSLLAAAGFGEAEIEEMPVTYRFADADELWFFVSELRGPVALALAELPDAERDAVRAEIEARATRILGRVRARRHQPERRGLVATIGARGALAEWLGSGLQSRLQRFESARRLCFQQFACTEIAHAELRHACWRDKRHA